MKDFLKIFIVAVFVFLPFLTFAQVEVGRRVNLSASPQNPTPGESVTLSVSSSEVDVDLSTIDWMVDGKSVKKGKGLRTFTFTAPANGKTSTVSVRVSPLSGKPINESITFSPADMDIIWEAENAYTPPFYKGKTLPLKQGQVKIVAIPNVRSKSGVMLKPADFAFNWKKDGQNMQGQSGFGKASFSYVSQLLEDTNRIDVSASNGLKQVSGSMIISYFEPEILFYEVDTLLGPKYQNALRDGIRPLKSQLALIAEPYFLPSTWKTDSGITFDWKLNNQKTSTKNKNMLTVNASGQTSSFNVNVTYNETKKLFRKFSKNLVVNPK